MKTKNPEVRLVVSHEGNILRDITIFDHPDHHDCEYFMECLAQLLLVPGFDSDMDIDDLLDAIVWRR